MKLLVIFITNALGANLLTGKDVDGGSRGCVGLELTVHGGVASQVTHEDFSDTVSVFFGCVARNPID